MQTEAGSGIHIFMNIDSMRNGITRTSNALPERPLLIDLHEVGFTLGEIRYELLRQDGMSIHGAF